MRVPKLRFKEFEGDWETHPVGSVCDFIVPARNKPKDFDGSIPWITIPDIEQNQRVYTSKSGLNITKDEALRTGSKIVPINAVIISCVGDLGLVAISGKEMVLNQQLHAFIPKKKIFYQFLVYELTNKKEFMEKVATKTSVLYMNKENCNSIPVCYPSIPEQTKIANFLTTIDDYINQLTRKHALLTQYKKAAMQQIFSQQLRFKDENGEAFADWEETKLGEITSKIGSGSTPRGGQEVYQKHGVLFIRSQNVNDGKLLLNDIVYISEKINNQMQGSVVEPNDILLNITGASIGRSCVVPSDFKVGNVNQHVCIIRLTKNHNPVFIHTFLSSDDGQKKIFSHQVGSGREGLNFQAIRSFKFYAPSFPEQIKIANFLTQLDQQLDQLQQQIDKVKQYKQGLLQQMFV
ncbi:MAG: restriction endonuclease subunit S [Pseudomonadota bacterium]|nr:restriction endonuclease subunit S [Pseudomonadota bacterium]